MTEQNILQRTYQEAIKEAERLKKENKDLKDKLNKIKEYINNNYWCWEDNSGRPTGILSIIDKES